MAYGPALETLIDLGRDLGRSEVRLRRIRSYVEGADLPMTARSVASETGIPVSVVAKDRHELWQRGQIGLERADPPAYR